MVGKDSGGYGVFSSGQLEQVIAASDTMPDLESLMKQLTKLAAEEVFQEGDISGQSSPKLDACVQLAEAAVQRDKVTRLYDGNFDDVMFSAVNLYQAKSAKNESYYIEGDFSNLFNCNKAVGKPRTNEIMAIIISIYQEALSEVSPAPHLIYGSRSGGDEFRFIVAGITEEHLQSAIQKARTRIEEFVQKMGLEQIEHSKYPGNPIRSGVGAEVAYKKMPVNYPNYDLVSEMDDAISEKKREAGIRKVQRGLEEIEDPLRIAKSPERLSRVDDAIQEYRKELDITPKDFPFEEENPEIRRGSVFRKRRDQVERTARALSMNEDESRFLMSVLDNIYDKKDDKTGMYRNRDFIHSLNDYMIQATRLGVPCYVVKMEAYNFSSLNEIFSHFGTDLIFRKMADLASRELAGLNAVCFARGGGIVSPVIPGASEEEINRAIENIIDAFHQQIGCKTIKEFCRENRIYFSIDALEKLNITERTLMSEIPSMRGLFPGSGFVVSKFDLSKASHFNEALESLDRQIDENKKPGIAYRTEEKVIYLNSRKQVHHAHAHQGELSLADTGLFHKPHEASREGRQDNKHPVVKPGPDK